MVARKKPPQPAAPEQLPLDLGVEIQKDVDGIEMGVLENGIPYLTQRGLAKITGIARSVLFDITREWEEGFGNTVLGKDRISFFQEYLFRNGFEEPRLYIETIKDGVTNYAYPDIVCMAFLEYYAFEARNRSDTAVKSYRRIATYGLQRFIYDSLDYVPTDSWRYYHDRVSLLKDSAPTGYFIVFNEMSGVTVDLITAGLTVNDKTIPDISVGQTWAAHWKANNLSEEYGERVEFLHYYPKYFPQASSNPQDAKAYPDAALPEFRRWIREEYLPTKFPSYILKKAHILPGGKKEALTIADMYKSKLLEGHDE